jgi:hypothetical protein
VRTSTLVEFSGVILRKGVFEMDRDNFDEAIDEIVAFTGGDMRLALRAILIESVLLEEKLRQINAAASANGTSRRLRSNRI